jgi:hypothetical protein
MLVRGGCSALPNFVETKGSGRKEWQGKTRNKDTTMRMRACIPLTLEINYTGPTRCNLVGTLSKIRLTRHSYSFCVDVQRSNQIAALFLYQQQQREDVPAT